MMDDCGSENGPLCASPAATRGRSTTITATACSAARSIRLPSASTSRRPSACTGPAGSMTIHHARTIHGSAVNTSDPPRRLLLFQYRPPMPGRSWAFRAGRRFNAASDGKTTDGAAADARAGAAAAAGRRTGLDLREPAHAREQLLRGLQRSSRRSGSRPAAPLDRPDGQGPWRFVSAHSCGSKFPSSFQVLPSGSSASPSQRNEPARSR